VHIAWPMMGIQNLTALRYGAEQWVVASGPLLFIVIPDGRPLGVTPLEITNPSTSKVTRASP